jgi:hypothetical protein
MRAISRQKTPINADFVRRVIAEKAHTQVSAAEAIGISPRAVSPTTPSSRAPGIPAPRAVP